MRQYRDHVLALSASIMIQPPPHGARRWHVGAGTARAARRQGFAAAPTVARRAPVRHAVAALASLLIFAGVAIAGPGTHEPAAKPILTIGISSGPRSLDPARDAPGVAAVLHLLTNAPITDQEPDGPVIGALATTYHYIGNDNEHFVFTLRHDARFSDGSVVNAQAVRTWLAYFLATRGPEVGALGDVSSIDTIGKWTVQLNLGAPNPNLPRVLSQAYDCGLVAGPRAVATPIDLVRQTDGAGPYVLVPSATIPNQRYTYVPNRYYYDKPAIKFRKIVVTVIPDAGAMLRAVDSGSVEVASGNLATASQATFANLRVLHYPTKWNGLVFGDPTGPGDPLADVRVRQALNYAVDRQSLAELAVGHDVGKYGAPGSIPAATQLWGAATSEIPTLDAFNEKYRVYYPYDPAKARRLLAAAGYSHGFPLYLKPLTDLPGAALGLRAITANFARIGVTVTTSPTAGLPTAIQVQEPARPMSALFGGDGLDGGQPTVLAKSSDALLGVLWQRARTMFPPAASASWAEMAERLTTRAWAVPFYDLDSLYYVSRRVGGVAASALTSVPDPTTWYPTGVPQPTYHATRGAAARGR
jgi:peptide/nickel transport system substrate-binding protein